VEDLEEVSEVAAETVAVTEESAETVGEAVVGAADAVVVAEAEERKTRSGFP